MIGFYLCKTDIAKNKRFDIPLQDRFFFLWLVIMTCLHMLSAQPVFSSASKAVPMNRGQSFWQENPLQSEHARSKPYLSISNQPLYHCKRCRKHKDIFISRIAYKQCKLTYALLNTMRPEQNGPHFADNTRILLHDNCCILTQNSLKLVTNWPISHDLIRCWLGVEQEKIIILTNDWSICPWYHIPWSFVTINY